MTTPSYNGTYNQDDPLVAPWYIAGWTSQQAGPDEIAVASYINNPSPLPANLVYVQVTASYYDFDNNPLSGFLTFLMSEDITVTSNGIAYRMPARYAGRDNSQTPGGINNWGSGRIYIRRGLMSVTLMNTGNPAIVTDSGNPLTYHVVEHFLGGQQFDISIPDSAVSPSDLRSLMVAGTAQTYNYDPANPMGNESYTPITTSASQSMITDIDGGQAGVSGLPGDIDGGAA